MSQHWSHGKDGSWGDVGSWHAIGGALVADQGSGSIGSGGREAHSWLHQLTEGLEGTTHRLLKGATHRYTCMKQDTPHTMCNGQKRMCGVWCVLLRACIPVGGTLQQPVDCAFQNCWQLVQPPVSCASCHAGHGPNLVAGHGANGRTHGVAAAVIGAAHIWLHQLPADLKGAMAVSAANAGDDSSASMTRPCVWSPCSGRRMTWTISSTQ